MIERFRILIVCSSGAARAVANRAAPGVGREAPYLAELMDRLARLGHDIELWTARGGDDLETESLLGGAVLRRFRRKGDFLVPRVRPGEWASEFVESTTQRLARIATTGPVIVSYRWEAGIAGRALSRGFGLTHVHIPDDVPRAIGRTGTTSSAGRQFEEDRQTCSEAAAVIATSDHQRDALVAMYGLPADGVVAVVAQRPDMGERFTAVLPPGHMVATTSPFTGDQAFGPPGVDPLPARRGPWHAPSDPGVPAPRSI